MLESLDHLFPGLNNIKPIGTGSFSNVYSAEFNLYKIPVAIKVISRNSLNSNSKLIHLQREIEIMKKIDHPFIIHYFNSFNDQYNYYLLMEFGSEGNILNVINQNGKLNEKDAQKMFCQLISALRYLHEEMNILHRDLKLENILLYPDFNIRLIDFGLSSQANLLDNLFSTYCGSIPYIAPEIIKKENYSYAIDMWSAGIILYSMVVGHLPFLAQNISNLIQLILEKEPDYPSFLSKELIDLLKRLLCKDPSLRLTAAETSFHPWLMNSFYCGFSSDSFLLNENFKILPKDFNSLDFSIVNQMKSLNMDIKEIWESLLINDNYCSAVYRMLKTNLLNSLLPTQKLSKINKNSNLINNPLKSEIFSRKKIITCSCLFNISSSTQKRSRFKKIGNSQRIIPNFNK